MPNISSNEIESSKSFRYTDKLMGTFVRLGVLNKYWSTTVGKESYLIKCATKEITTERSNELTITINGVSSSIYNIFC